MRRFVSMIMISGASAITFAVAGVPFNGKKGAALLEAVASSSRPSAVVQRQDLNFGMTDEFMGTAVEIKSGALPDGYEWGCLIPAEWWSNSWEVYGAAVSGDIYNIVPLCGDVRSYRRDLAPVESVGKPAYSNGLWSAGLTVLYGVETEAYSPPAALRGELARAFMYMAVVYHVATWTERAYMMMDGYAYPGLTDYAIPLLLDWHRANPPSVHEIAKNERGERLQGNRNPLWTIQNLPNICGASTGTSSLWSTESRCRCAGSILWPTRASTCFLWKFLRMRHGRSTESQYRLISSFRLSLVSGRISLPTRRLRRVSEVWS